MLDTLRGGLGGLCITAALSLLPGLACDDDPAAPFDASPSAPDANELDAHQPDVLQDAGAQDASAQGPDAQAPDALAPDAQLPDAQAPDAQTPDAQTPDAQAPDAGPPPQPLGAPCGPEHPPCVHDALCVGEGERGRCRRACDPSGDGCDPGNLCQPLSGAPDRGWCVPSDRCGTHERPGCPGGLNSTCVTRPPLSLCVSPGQGALNMPCLATAEGDDPQRCLPGLFCHYGRCKAPCDDAGACGEGELCVDYTERLGGVGYRFCHRPCDPADPQSCGLGAQCRPVDQQGGAMIGACMSTGGLLTGQGLQGARCSQSPQLPSGSCRGDHICAVGGPDWPSRCGAWCDRAEPARCGSGSACVVDLWGHGEGGQRTATGPLTDVGACLGECDPFAEESGCGADLRCEPTHRALDGAGQPTVIGWCRPITPWPPAGDGDFCQIDDTTGASNCQRGHLCLPQAGFVNRCVALCRLDRPEPGCPAQQRCVATDALPGAAGIGLCAPR